MALIDTLETVIHPVDRHVGSRVRMRRKLLGISQEKLAHALGVSFQQVQKYERGSNRISASKLYEIACALDVPVLFFFEDLPSADALDDERERARAAALRDFLASADGLDWVEAIATIRSPQLRRKALALTRALGGDKGD